MKYLAIFFALIIVAAATVGGYFYFLKYIPALQALETNDGKIFKLETDIAKTKADRDVMEARLNEANSKIDELTAKDASKTETVNEIEETYNELINELKKEIDEGQIEITTLKEELTVNVLDKILFDSGKTKIKPRGLEVLRKVGDILKKAKGKLIIIEGHTDNVPISNPAVKKKYPTNWELSTARATTVVRYLQDKSGIDPKSLIAIGYSQYCPVADNSTDEGKSRNRRIEIILKPDKRNPKPDKSVPEKQIPTK